MLLISTDHLHRTNRLEYGVENSKPRKRDVYGRCIHNIEAQYMESPIPAIEESSAMSKRASMESAWSQHGANTNPTCSSICQSHNYFILQHSNLSKHTGSSMVLQLSDHMANNFDVCCPGKPSNAAVIAIWFVVELSTVTRSRQPALICVCREVFDVPLALLHNYR